MLLLGERSTKYFIQKSKTTKVYHSKASCGSSKRMLEVKREDVREKRPCRRCVSAPEPGVEGVIECLDLEDDKIYSISLEDLDCNCSSARGGKICPHLRFVFDKFFKKPHWLDEAFEYGGLSPEKTRKLIHMTENRSIELNECRACFEFVEDNEGSLHPACQDILRPYE